MKAQASVTYTVRGVPKEVDAELRRKAARQKKSLNQVIVDELSQSSVERKKMTDLSDLVGSWEPDPEFDATIASIRKIDWKKWK